MDFAKHGNVALARYYAGWLGRWTAVDPAGLVDGVNLYMYCRGNPVRLVDPNGLSPTFCKDNNRKWNFLMDNNIENSIVSTLGMIPFLDNAFLGLSDIVNDCKTVTQEELQDIATKAGATATAADLLLGKASKLTKVAGIISDLITIVNIGYEFNKSDPYINQITHEMFGDYYPSYSFDTTLINFAKYAEIVKEFIDEGIVTYSVDRGFIEDLKIDWDKYNSYFDNLGISSAKEIAEIKPKYNK
jgi:uncharacterized protein RhaS with RHS repeats